MSASRWAPMISRSSGGPLICLSAPLRRPPVHWALYGCYGGSRETSVADPVRYEGKWRRSSGSSLAALGLRGLLGGAALDEYRLLIQGGSKGERCLSCSPAAGPEAALLVWGFKVEAGSGSVLTARRSQKKKSWHMGVQDFWGQAPLGKKGITGCLSLPSALDAALSPTQGDWDTRHPWGGL